MKYQKIPTTNLGAIAYYLLQITRGVFKWNGELFFCPFVTMENKRHSLQVRTWIKEGVTGKDKKYSLPYIDHNMLCLFADPVHPSTYIRTKQRSMDKSLGIDASTVVLKSGNKLIIKKNATTFKKGNKIVTKQSTAPIHTLEFVRKLSDTERKNIFDPNDVGESELRSKIWKTSKEGSSPYSGVIHRDEWLRRYEEYRKDKEIPSRFSGRAKQFLLNEGDW